MKEGGGGGGRKETLADKPLGFLPFFPTPSPLFYLFHFSPGGGGDSGIFWVGMCRPGLQIGTSF